MGTYLSDYLSCIASLPLELKRNFTLMRELDGRSEKLMTQIDEASREYHPAARKAFAEGRDPDEAIMGRILEDLRQCLQYGDEKVDLAMQTYELVDKHIRRLDDDLRKFESELEVPLVEGVSAKALSNSRKRKASDSLTNPKGNKVSKPNSSKGGNGKGKNRNKKKEVQDMPIDPNEPTYCLCSRVSFGQMVGCDNDDCLIEWFHYSCVGLTEAPKGKWYCPDCSAKRKGR